MPTPGIEDYAQDGFGCTGTPRQHTKAPNIEARLAYGVGEKQEYMGAPKQRPVEFGVSGVVGQIRITEPNFARVVDDIWALGCDWQWAITDRLGMKGELFVGQTLGEYNAGVLQNFNSQTFGPIRTRGGFAIRSCGTSAR